MRSAIALSVAALAGSALAHPSYGQYQHKEVKEVKDVHVVVETVIHTVYVTEGAYQAYTAKPTSSKTKPVYQAPTTTVLYESVEPTSTSIYVAPPAPTSEAPKSISTAVYTPAPEPTSEAPKPITTAAYTPAPEPTSEAPTSTAAAPSASAAPPSASAAPPSGDTYIAIVSEWRAKLGLKDLESSAELEKNALNCVTASNGVMTHKLNPGTYGQVLAPGKDNMVSFLSVFVGGWLCEIPSLPGLDGVCSTMSEGWSYEGQTGHAEILTSDSYSKIGCAWYAGIWGCDLA